MIKPALIAKVAKTVQAPSKETQIADMSATSLAHAKTLETGVKTGENKSKHARDLVTLLCACVALRMFWVFMIPISEAPDEGAHYWVIEFLQRHGQLPGAHDVFSNPAAAYYGALPPFGYIPHLVAATFGSALSLALSARLGSVLAAMLMVSAAYGIAKELFGDKRWMVAAVPALLVFHPQLVFVQSYSNNDSTTAALVSVALYIALRWVKYGLTLKRCLLFGAVCGWLLLCKFSGYCVLPALAFAFIAAARLHKASRQQTLACIVAAVAVPAALSGWWFWRNLAVFHDLTGVKTMLDTWATAYKVQLAPLYRWPVINHPEWRRTAFASFWGLFGNMNRPFPSAVYTGFATMIGLSLAGWVAAFARSAREARRRPSTQEQADSQGTEAWRSVYTGVLALAALLSFCGLVYAALAPATAATPPQGRYLFPAEVPIMCLLVMGLGKFQQPWGKWLLVGAVIFTAAACLSATLTLLPLYGLDSHPMRCALAHPLW